MFVLGDSTYGMGIILKGFLPPSRHESAKSITVKRLRADGGPHALGIDAGGPGQMIAWAGETWSYPLDNGNGHFVDGVARSEIVAVCDGRIVVDVEDIVAAMILLDGSSDYDEIF